MVKKMSNLSSAIKLTLFLLVGLSVSATAQEDQQKKKQDEIERPSLIDQSTVPFFNGIFIGYDLLGPIYKVYSDDYLTTEFSIDVNLKNRIFPVLELGYGNTNKWSDNGIQYKTKAPYFRLGADYNFLYKKHKNNHLTVGLRYAFTTFDFDIDNLSLEDGVWGDQIQNPGIHDDVWNESFPMDKKSLSSSMHWLEFVVGVRTSIWKNLYMGWSLRFKYRLSIQENDFGDPWYVPGFGINKGTRFGVNYSIIYRIPSKKSKKIKAL